MNNGEVGLQDLFENGPGLERVKLNHPRVATIRSGKPRRACERQKMKQDRLGTLKAANRFAI